MEQIKSVEQRTDLNVFFVFDSLSDKLDVINQLPFSLVNVHVTDAGVVLLEARLRIII